MFLLPAYRGDAFLTLEAEALENGLDQWVMCPVFRAISHALCHFIHSTIQQICVEYACMLDNQLRVWKEATQSPCPEKAYILVK